MSRESAVGHSLQIVARRKSVHVRYAPKATASGQGVASRDGPIADKASIIWLCQEIRNLTGVLDEEPCDGAERTILQGEDSDRHWGHWQLNRQNLDLSAPGWKSQCGSREHR